MNQPAIGRGVNRSSMLIPSLLTQRNAAPFALDSL
jgi:hypothetical protein